MIIGASVCAHLAIATYAWIADVDTRPMLGPSVAQQYRQETMEVTLPEDPLPTTIPDPGPGAATPVSSLQTPRPIVPRTRVTAQPPTAATTDDALRFASILTGSEVGRTGDNDLSRRQPGADLSAQLDAVGDRTVVIGNTDGGFHQREREGIGTVPGPTFDDPTRVVSVDPKRPERQPAGRIQIRPLPPRARGQPSPSRWSSTRSTACT